jgi:serine/threonine protein phosphatase PrpC
MKNTMLDLIKNSQNAEDFNTLEHVFSLYEQLQYSEDLTQMAEDIYDWLNKYYHVDNVTFSLFNIQTQKKREYFCQRGRILSG